MDKNAEQDRHEELILYMFSSPMEDPWCAGSQLHKGVHAVTFKHMSDKTIQHCLAFS